MNEINIRNLRLRRIVPKTWDMISAWEVSQKENNTFIRIGVIFQMKTKILEQKLGHRRFKFRYWFGEGFSSNFVTVDTTRNKVIDKLLAKEGLELK